MSTPFYDLASLVLVPSGYKASKVYAQKPLTTDGQLTFSRASTATRVNNAGLIETVSSNVPRLDYLGSTCPKLQLEPSRTNIVLKSEAFDDAQWFKESLNTVTANTVAAPDGTTTADTITCTNGNNLNVNQALTITSTGSHTLSIFLKKKTSSVIGIYFFTLQGGAQFAAKANLNLDTGVATADVGTTTVTNYGNGWYRLTVTGTLTAGAVTTCGIYTDSNTGTRDVYAWGAMAELGAYATSYVKTEAAAVTRLADACSKTGISSLIGQTEGTIFAEFQYYDNIAVGSNQYISPLTISNGGYTEAVFFEIFNDSLTAVVFKNSTLQAAITKSNLTSGTHRAALAYKQNDIAFYLDGILVGTDSSADISSAMSQINLATIGGSTNLDQAYTQTQALLFKTRLTNAQLAELTTL